MLCMNARTKLYKCHSNTTKQNCFQAVFVAVTIAGGFPALVEYTLQFLKIKYVSNGDLIDTEET